VLATDRDTDLSHKSADFDVDDTADELVAATDMPETHAPEATSPRSFA